MLSSEMKFCSHSRDLFLAASLGSTFCSRASPSLENIFVLASFSQTWVPIPGRKKEETAGEWD